MPPLVKILPKVEIFHQNPYRWAGWKLNKHQVPYVQYVLQSHQHTDHKSSAMSAKVTVGSDQLLSDLCKNRTASRIRQMKFKKNFKLKKRAAVLVSLCSVKGKPSLLYTVRSQDLRNHSGQVSFPGGLCDLTDRDVIHTALRETEEEIGISQSTVDVWEVMPSIPDRTRTTTIYPVVGNLGNISDCDLVRNQTEVSKIFTVPLNVLCDPKCRSQTTFRDSIMQDHSSTYTLPLFLTKPRIWGLTAIITEHFLYAMFPDLTNSEQGFVSIR